MLPVEQNATAAPKIGGSAAIRVMREPTSLLSLVDTDPITAGIVNHFVLETLVRMSDDGTTARPELAERFEIDEASHTYTFYLAENARWHDGTPVTSTDVRFVFGKLSDPFNPFPQTHIFSNIADIDTPNADTVIFKLDKRVPGFTAALAEVPILPMHVFGRTPLPLHEASRAPVGSGPYRFVRWVPSQMIEIERNPDWRGKQPYLDEIRFLFVPDNRIAVDMFTHGDLDIILDYPTGASTPTEDARIVSFPLPYIETWLFNRNRPIFREASVRRATSMLIDKRVIRCAALECQADLTDESPLSDRPDALLFPTVSFDPNAARRLLDSAGWRIGAPAVRVKGTRELRFSLLVPNLGRDAERAAVIIQEDLAGAGIDMKISMVSRGAFMGRISTGRFDAAAVPMPLGAMDGSLSFLHSESGFSTGGEADRKMDALIDALRAELGNKQQAELRRQIATHTAQSTPLAYLYRPYGAALVRSSLAGVHITDGHLKLTELFQKEAP